MTHSRSTRLVSFAALAPLAFMAVVFISPTTGCGSTTPVPCTLPPFEPPLEPIEPPADDAGLATVDLDATTEDASPSEGGIEGASAAPTCASACSRLRTVRCRTGSSVDGGDSCTVTCTRVLASRLIVLDVACAARATTLQAARACRGWGC